MESQVGSANDTAVTATRAPTNVAFGVEEEDAIVTLVVVVMCIIIAIIVLFSMGIFIDCKYQKKDSCTKRKRLNLKIPSLADRSRKDDVRWLASDMYPNGIDLRGDEMV